jgi:alpha-glucosidase
MTDAPRTASVPLDFLEDGVTYEADVYRDGDSKTALVKEKKTVTRQDVLTLPMHQAGGFAVHVHLPVPPSPSPSPGRP